MGERKERPILFSAPMVRAIFNGEKTVTRRIVDERRLFAKVGDFFPLFEVNYRIDREQATRIAGLQGWTHACPYGQPDDRLWVKEGFAFGHVHDAAPPSDVPPTYPSTIGFMGGAQMDTSVWYRCDVEADPARHESWILRGRWRSPLHMPRWASRLALAIESVRVERLHDITEDDARAEGVARANGHPVRGAVFGRGPSYREGFAQIWINLNGADSWRANPWVWRVGFRREGASRA
jgi:hypothetical protein